MPYRIRMDSHPKFGLNVETDNTTQISKDMKNFITLIMRLFGKSRVIHKQV